MNALKSIARWILRKEIAAYEADMRKLSDPTIEHFHIDSNGRIDAAFRHPWALALMANAFHDTLVELPCDNYVECLFRDTKRDLDIVVTIHKPGGKTPHQLREEAEAKLKARTP